MKTLKKNIWKYIAVMSLVLISIIGFQNCQQDERNIINVASHSAPPVDNVVEFLLLPEEILDKEIVVLTDHFNINTSVTFSLGAFMGEEARFEKYDNFEWSVFLHEDLGNAEAVLVNEDDDQRVTTQTDYKWSSDRTGVYDISSDLTSSQGEPSVSIDRMVVIGQCESSPLKIQFDGINVSQTAENSSFTSVSSLVDRATFSVNRSDSKALNVSNGLWEVRHNGYRFDSGSLDVDQYTQLTMIMVNTIKGDVITLEFFTQLEDESCITYSEKRYKKTSDGLSLLSESSSTTTTSVSTTTTATL